MREQYLETYINKCKDLKTKVHLYVKVDVEFKAELLCEQLKIKSKSDLISELVRQKYREQFNTDEIY